MGIDVDQIFGVNAGTLQLVRVAGYEFAQGEDGQPATDSLGNPIPTGRLDVTTLNREGLRSGVAFALPVVGNSAFMGAFPEIGAIGILGFFEQDVPLIIGFLPPGLENLINGRGTIPALQPGEILLQASAPDVTDEGRSDIFVGASIKLDAYGRKIVTVEGYKLIIGYLISDEYTAQATGINDPITGKPIYLEETLPAGVGRRVDNAGNTVWTYGGTKYERMEAQDVKVNGLSVSEARDGHVFKDRSNNAFGTDVDGNFSVNLATGGATLDTNAGQTFRSGGPVTRQTIKDLAETIGGNFDLRTGKIKTEFAMAEIKQIATTLVEVVIGAVARTAGTMALVGLLGPITLIAPQILLGPTPVPLAQGPALLALLQAFFVVLSTGANAGGNVVFGGLGTLQAALQAAGVPGPTSILTTIVKGT